MAQNFAAEIIDAVNNNGGAFKKKKICIEWQKLIKHLHIINGKRRVKHMAERPCSLEKQEI